MNYTIELATPNDAEEILAIYAPYIKNTAITFEYDVPTIEQFRHRMETVLETYPWIVYKENGVIAGYAYVGQFRTRAAFMWDVESSIYLHPDFHGRGIAIKLYDALTALLKLQGFVNMYAFISVPNESSQRLHEKVGFQPIGIYEKSGYKFNQWYSLLAMNKKLNDCEHPNSYRKITELTDEEKKTILSHV